MEASIGRVSTSESLVDFLTRYQWEAVRVFLADFARVGTGTALRYKKGTEPVGEPLLRVRVLLTAAGYRLTEFDSLPVPVQQFATAVALGLTSPEEASEMLGYKDSKGVFDLVLRNKGMQPHRYYRLERFVQASKKEIDEGFELLRQKAQTLPLEAGTPGLSAESSPEPGPWPEPKPELVEGPSPREPISEPIRSSRSSPDPLVSGLAYSLLAADDLSQALNKRPDSARLVQELYTIVDRSDVVDIIEQLQLLIATE